ncbi:MAG: hypothetical protein Q4D14_06305 [Bacteroidales bacterium]|nr:hypothetical protein [Bacteroidales bacterium]
MKRALIALNVAIVVVTIMAMPSCKNQKDTEADVLYQQIVSAYENEAYETALMLIDSLHRTYVTRVDVRRCADTIAWRIDLLNTKEQIPIVDSLLEQRCQEAEVMAKNFKYEKNEQYQDLGDYEHQRLLTANNLGRTYLHARTNEHGEFSITAQHVGKAINMRSITVTVDDVPVSSEQLGEESYNAFAPDGSSTRENLLLNANAAGDIPQFVADNYTGKNKVNVTLHGDSDFSFVMTSNDVAAFVETYRLSLLLKEIHQLQMQKETNAKKLVLLQEHLQEL